MPFLKLGESIDILRVENTESCVAAVSEEILDKFKKFAANLKKIAPKAEDFLYFSAVMMHAAEAAAINEDGTPRLTASGMPVQVGWDKSGGTWRWTSNDKNVKPYKNSNGDIFPEEELVRAYKKWIGKPLCIDHKSSSVDHVRGFIVDTYYDRNLKRVVALCALDKAGYPQLARQVSTGVSNCVSMGTAVGRAICSDCATVARTESDFCDHMRRKSCYGEINIDLNPIELSIVVNGADPRANIKHIIAAANTLNNYVDSKSKELNTLAANFAANISFNTDSSGGSGALGTSFNINASSLEKFKEELDAAFHKLSEIAVSAKNSEQSDTNDAYNQSSGSVAMDESALPNTDLGLAPPSGAGLRYASEDADSIKELKNITATIEGKLSQMKQSLNKLASFNKQEENMSDLNKKGYYQGTEEPTPGSAKYPKDPKNEDLRLHGDKQMVGQMDTGPVDGMHPGPDSVNTSEFERKKMLARAEAEMRRNTIVSLTKEALEQKKMAEHKKEGYWYGGGGVNEPTPGKVKYPIDKLNEQLRDREDKQMVGQSPFPGVGPVDGLHPSPASADVKDEKKRKEMLQRASLKARFVKAANNDGTQNFGKSAWEVFLGDKLLLTASVGELSGGHTAMLYDSIATKEFGTRLLEKVRAHGVDKIRSFVKSGQEGPAPAAPPVDAPPADAGAAPVDESGIPTDEAKDTGKSGDPKEGMGDKVQQAKTQVDELSKTIYDLGEFSGALTGEKAEMGKEESLPSGAGMGSSASGDFSTATLNIFRRELNGALNHAMKESMAELNDHKEELEMIVGMFEKGAINESNEEFVTSIVDDALSESKSALADGLKLINAGIKYARGTKAIVKRAEIERELEALAEGEDMSGGDNNSDDDLMSLINDTNADLDAAKDMVHGDDLDESLLGSEIEGAEHGDLGMHDELSELGLADDNDGDATLELRPGEPLPSGVKVDKVVTPGAQNADAGFDSKASRAALRAKLAADATGKEDDGNVQDMSKQKFSDMLDQADHLADGQTSLDVKPSDDLGYVETLPEVNKEMMELAKAPPKVRKEAEVINKLISEGKLDPADLDELVREGLDKDAVSYWKKYYGQTEGGGEFAGELVKEHVKAQLEEQLNVFRVKMARAYELAYEMVERGLCHSDRSAISAQVDEIMKFNDESFDSLKRVVARHAPVMKKEAGRMPQVGMIGVSGEVNTGASGNDSLFEQLSAAFSKTSKKMF